MTKETRRMMSMSVLGTLPKSRSEDHAKVEWQTSSITPTRALIGTIANSGDAKMRPTPRNAAIAIPESRDVPPDSTFISDCPMSAQPPIPPVRPDLGHQ